VKREGDIRIIEVIEDRITNNSHHNLLHDSGSEGDYNTMGEDGKSALFFRKYQVKCSKYYIVRGYFDIVLRFDYRRGAGRVVISGDAVPALCQISPDMKSLLYSLARVGLPKIRK
jgi:hypothetical protein